MLFEERKFTEIKLIINKIRKCPIFFNNNSINE